MEQDILGRISQLKSNVQDMLHKFSDQDFESALQKVKERIHKMTESDDEIHPIKIDNYHYESHYPDDDDLQLTMARESEAGIRYYDTENSPFARGAEKVVARGIDKFDDEEDEVEEVFEEDIKRKASRTKKKVAKKAPSRKRKLH